MPYLSPHGRFLRVSLRTTQTAQTALPGTPSNSDHQGLASSAAFLLAVSVWAQWMSPLMVSSGSWGDARPPQCGKTPNIQRLQISLVKVMRPPEGWQHGTHKPHPKPNQATFQASPAAPPPRCQDPRNPQLNLFMKCSGLRTRSSVRAQNGRSPKEARKTAIQEAFVEPRCIQQSLHQRTLPSLSRTTTWQHSSNDIMHGSNSFRLAVSFSIISGTAYPAWLWAFQSSLGHPPKGHGDLQETNWIFIFGTFQAFNAHWPRRRPAHSSDVLTHWGPSHLEQIVCCRCHSKHMGKTLQANLWRDKVWGEHWPQLERGRISECHWWAQLRVLWRISEKLALFRLKPAIRMAWPSFR